MLTKFKIGNLRSHMFQPGSPSRRTGAAGDHEQGVALVITLILLALMSILGLAMVLSMSAGMLINGYYRNYRGAFYAADSGLNIARQQTINQLNSGFPTTAVTGWAVGAPPLANPSATATSALSSVTSAYGSSFALLNTGQGVNSWAESFEITNTGTCTNSLTIAPGSPTVTSTYNGQNTGYQYIFNYTLCSTGRALASQQVNTSETGSFTISITVPLSQTATTQASFASFGDFINNYSPCSGALVPGIMTGPMFTNGAWQFGTTGAYTFTDSVGQANANADYWFGGTCIQSPTNSYKYKSQTIAPTFEQGLNLSQNAAPLPANSFAQEWAVLDGKGSGEGSSAPTDAQMNSVLKNISGTAYPPTGATSGVYLPYSAVNGVNTISGGGVYVEGSASVQLSLGNDTAGNPTQIYTITQSGTTTTVTTNVAANNTTVKSGSTTLTLAGVPQNLNPTPAQAATMLYVDGTITSLSGPGQGQAGIQDGSQITIVANGNVDITGDVLYKTEPVTTTQNQIVAGSNPACCSGDPVDTLIPENNKGQDLGIFTATGNIQLSSNYSNQNLEVDGSLAAVSQNCASNSCGFTVSGAINTFNNVGGQIQSNIFGANMQTENTYFDRRYTSIPGFAPAWFPSTTIQTVDITNAATPVITPVVQRISWLTSPQ
jgi:Tfp pilus assembly protein PilX